MLQKCLQFMPANQLTYYPLNICSTYYRPVTWCPEENGEVNS